MSVQQDERASRIVGLLAAAPHPESLPVALSWLQTGDCDGSRHHSPSPLLIKPVYLSSLLDEVLGGDARAGEDLVYLCSTCRDNVTVYLSILYAYNGAAPRAVKRDFGNLTLTLGERAWQYWSGPTPV